MLNTFAQCIFSTKIQTVSTPGHDWPKACYKFFLRFPRSSVFYKSCIGRGGTGQLWVLVESSNCACSRVFLMNVKYSCVIPAEAVGFTFPLKDMGLEVRSLVPDFPFPVLFR